MIYAAIMARIGRLKVNYRMYPVENFDGVFTYIMMRLPEENREKVYRRAKHQDKLATIKILMEWDNLLILFSE